MNEQEIQERCDDWKLLTELDPGPRFKLQQCANRALREHGEDQRFTATAVADDKIEWRRKPGTDWHTYLPSTVIQAFERSYEIVHISGDSTTDIGWKTWLCWQVKPR